MQSELTCDRLVARRGFWLVIMEMEVQNCLSSVTSLYTVDVVDYQCHRGWSFPSGLFKLKIKLGIYSVYCSIVATSDQDVVVRRN